MQKRIKLDFVPEHRRAVVERLIDHRGIQWTKDSEVSIKNIVSADSDAVFNELSHDSKLLGLSTYANISQLCPDEQSRAKVIRAARLFNRNAANLMMMELTGYDLKGKRAGGET